MPRLFITIFFFMFIVFPIFSQATQPVITPDNIQQLQQQHVFGHDSISHIEYSPDDSRLLQFDTKMRLWDTQTGELVYEDENGGLEFQFNADGRYLMGVTYDGKINMYDLTANQLLYTTFYDERMEDYIEANEPIDPNYDLYITHQNPNFSPNMQTFFTTLSNTLYLRDLQTGALIQAHTIPNTELIEQAIFSSDGRHIITVSQGDRWWSRTIQWWDIATWTADVVIENTQAAVISPDARYVAYGLDNEIWLFDTQTGENRLLSSTYRAMITHLRFSEDGQFLYSGTEGEISKWWDIETGAFITSDNYIGTRNRPLELTLCRENDVITYCVIDVRTQEAIFTLTGHVENLSYASFNHAGTQIVTHGVNGTIRLWGIGD